MFGRIGLDQRPLLDRIESARNRFDFGTVSPPFAESMPVTPPSQPQQSPVDVMNQSAQEPPTVPAAMGIISEALVKTLDNADETSKELLRRWTGFREELSGFFTARKSTRETFLKGRDRELIRDGRKIREMIGEIVRQQNEALMQWNGCEAALSDLRAKLNSLLAKNPRPDPTDAWNFADDTEVTAWQAQVDEIRAAIDRQKQAADLEAYLKRGGRK